LDIKLQVLEVHKPDDIDTAFSILRGRPQALIFLPSPMIYRQSARLAELALKHRLPATSMAREFVNAGGALAYGPGRPASWERSAVLVAKILAGSNPAELPVERPTKIQLVVNLKTAKALGITIPQSILLRADEVIK
jgi:putative ABC transport system substrate-binding protein